MARLQGKVSLVTAAGSGIGQSIAILFGAEGSTVVVNDRKRETVEATAAKIQAAGGKAVVELGDVSLGKDVERIIDRTVQTQGRIDILVNVAGGALGVNLPAGETTEEQWDSVIANNVKSTFLMSKMVLPSMIKNGGGAIVNMGSLFAFMGVPNMAAYCTAKAAVVNLTRQMAVDYGAHNIRVNCLCPGPIITPAIDRHLRTGFEKMKSATLVGRLGRPEDVAYGALYLASDEASFVTGTALVIDGGYDPRLAV